MNFTFSEILNLAVVTHHHVFSSWMVVWRVSVLFRELFLFCARKENAFEIDKNKLKQTPDVTRQDKGDSKRIDPHL
jgi:hypothetical protein